MPRKYIHNEPDHATAAQYVTVVVNTTKVGQTRLSNWPLGDMYIFGDEILKVITANNGTTVTFTSVGAQV